jgi:putative peptide zinc metalloprotease protein
MFIASVSTLVFNANPLLRFDGYYILSDVLDIPNLSSRSMLQLRHFVEKYFLGYNESKGAAGTFKEALWLSVFGVLSGLYRVVVFTGIILFLADKFLLAGMIMVVVCIISWVIVPLYRVVNYLATSPRLQKSRGRAVGFSVSLAGGVLFFLLAVPFPNRFRAPGIIESINYVKVVSQAPGYMEKLLVPSGETVEKGTGLIELSDYELLLDIDKTRAQKTETKALFMRAMQTEIADIKPLTQRLAVIENRLKELDRQKEDLIIKARQDGVWVAPLAKDQVGAYIHKGSGVGELVGTEQFRFFTIVNQDDAANLFGDQIKKIQVRVKGHSGKNIDVSDYKIVPYQQQQLPSAALGWLGGGDIAVSSADNTGTMAAEPFFQIFAYLQKSDDVLLLHGRSGKLRFSMQPKPLLVQWWRKIRQLLQKRYKI